MSSTHTDDVLRRTRSVRLVRLGSSTEYGPHALVLAVVLVLSPAGVILCARGAGAGLPWSLVLLSPLLVPLVARAGTVLPSVVVGALLVLWVLTVPASTTWWALPAATCLLALHVAAGLLASTPTTVRWPPATRRRWLRRMLIVVLATTAVTGASDLVSTSHLSGGVVVGALALLIVAAFPWVSESRLGPSGSTTEPRAKESP